MEKQGLLIWYATSMALLPGVRITSEICLLTATLAEKNNPLLTHCYYTIGQITKKLLLKGGEFVSDGL